LRNGSQILDITYGANLNPQSPAYVVYENGHLARLGLFNYVSDPSGAHDIQFTFSIGGQSVGQPNGTPAQVKVKCVLALSFESVTDVGVMIGILGQAQ
jgi:hypothetical protein